MHRLIVVTGAGMDADSGIPTFRTGSDAVWENYKLQDVCDYRNFMYGWSNLNKDNGSGVNSDGENYYTLTHKFYNDRRKALKEVEPHIGHKVLGDFYKMFPDQVLHITTNVSDLLERGGTDESVITHVHGKLTEVYADKDGNYKSELINTGYEDFDETKYTFAKPNVIFFGEQAPLYKKMWGIFDSVTQQDLVLVIGASNQVIDFNYEIVRPAKNIGAKVFVVNPNLTEYEEEIYDGYGVYIKKCTAKELFSNKDFVNLLKTHLEGSWRQI